MFKVVSEPTFTHPVKVMVPVDGGHQEQTFKTKFRVLPLSDEQADGTDEGEQATLRRAIVSMSDVVGEDDQPLEYSDHLRDQLIAVPYVRIGLMRAYIAAVAKARVGN